MRRLIRNPMCPDARVADAAVRPLLTLLLLLFVLGGAVACSSGPRYQGMSGEQLYRHGVAAFEEEDWSEAIRALQQLVTTNPGFAQNPQARMYVARAYFERGEYLTASSEFELFLQRHPSHGLAPEASLGSCRALAELAPIPQRDQEYTRRARDACRRTVAEFEGMNVAEEAAAIRDQMVDRLAERWYQEGRWYQRRNMHNSAIIVFQDLVDFYPQTSWAPPAMLALYRSYEVLGWEEEMQEVRDRLLFLYPDSEAAAEISRQVNGSDDA